MTLLARSRRMGTVAASVHRGGRRRRDRISDGRPRPVCSDADVLEVIKWPELGGFLKQGTFVWASWR